MTRYWILNSGDWTDTAHWSSSSGGLGGASVPIGTDDVFFDISSFNVVSQTVTVGPGTACNDLIISGTLFPPIFSNSAVDIVVNGNYAVDDPGVTFTSLALNSIRLSGIGTILANDSLTGKKVIILGDYVLAGDLFGLDTLSVQSGSFDANDFNISASTFDLRFNTPILMGNGTWEVDSSLGSSFSFGFMIDQVAVTTPITAEGSTINFISGYSLSLGLHDHTWNNIIFAGGRVGGSYTTAITGTPVYTINSFENNGNAIFRYEANYVITTFTSNGEDTRQISLSSSIPGNQVSISAAIVNISYTTVQDILAQGVAIPFIDSPGGIDNGNNTNWSFLFLLGIFPLQGTKLGGTVIKLTGSGFVAGNTTVDIGGNTIAAVNVAVNGAGTEAIFTSPAHATGVVTVSVTIPSTTSNTLNYAYTEGFILSPQTTFLSFADTNGDVQNLNATNSDNGNPIYFELETQELEFGNRAHLKNISDKIVVFTNFGIDTHLQCKQDDGDYEDINITLNTRVNIGKNINLTGHFFTFKWSGETDLSSPIFEGFTLENIDDKGITDG